MVAAPSRRNEHSVWETAKWQGVGRSRSRRLYRRRAPVVSSRRWAGVCPGSAEMAGGGRRAGAGREDAWRGTPESRRARWRKSWKRPMYRAGIGRGSSQRTWSKLGRRVCWMPVSRTMRACSSLPLGPRGHREHRCSVLPASCGDVQPISVCSMPKRRAESTGTGVHAGAKRRVVSAGAGFLLTGTGAGGGGGVTVAGSLGAVARGTTAAGRDARCLGGVRGASAGRGGWGA